MQTSGEENKWNARQPDMMQPKQSGKDKGKKEHELQSGREDSEILGRWQLMSSPSLAFEYNVKYK